MRFGIEMNIDSVSMFTLYILIKLRDQWLIYEFSIDYIIICRHWDFFQFTTGTQISRWCFGIKWSTMTWWPLMGLSSWCYVDPCKVYATLITLESMKWSIYRCLILNQDIVTWPNDTVSTQWTLYWPPVAACHLVCVTSWLSASQNPWCC